MRNECSPKDKTLDLLVQEFIKNTSIEAIQKIKINKIRMLDFRTKPVERDIEMYMVITSTAFWACSVNFERNNLSEGHRHRWLHVT